MVNTFLSYLALYGLKSNIVVMNGSGVLLFQREKSYRSFRYIGAVILIFGVILCSAISYALNNYVYPIIDLAFADVTITVSIVCIYHILVSNIWRKISSFKVYLYENSFSYAMDVVFTLSLIFMFNMTLPVVEFVMSVLAACIVIAVMNMLMGIFVGLLNRAYVNKSFRNVSTRLFLFAIIYMIVYYASLLVV